MSDEGRATVPVPANAVRDEPLAFGLTGVQLLVLAAAAAAALLANLAPLPEPLRLVLVTLTTGPIAASAVVRIADDPAYRWLFRAVRHRTSTRTWTARLQVAAKPQISGKGDTGPSEGPSMATPRDSQPPAAAAPPDPRDADPLLSERAATAQIADEIDLPPPIPAARLRLLSEDDPRDDPAEGSNGSAEVPPGVIPHLVAGLRVVTLVSFAGGVGRTTIAVELATLLAERGRYRTIDGAEHTLSVLVIDAARLAPAVGLRLGLDPATLARLPAVDWRAPDLVERDAVRTRTGVGVFALPARLPLDATEGLTFGATQAAAILEGADRAGYRLVIADLGGVHEEGHRHLIDQAALVLGVVRPTLESLPDVLRLAEYVRGLGMGRKLAIVANAAADDVDLRRLASEAEVAYLGRIGPTGAASLAAERGEPAWKLDPTLAADLTPVAAAIWPLASVGPSPSFGFGAALARARDLLMRRGTG